MGTTSAVVEADVDTSVLDELVNGNAKKRKSRESVTDMQIAKAIRDAKNSKTRQEMADLLNISLQTFSSRYNKLLDSFEEDRKNLMEAKQPIPPHLKDLSWMELSSARKNSGRPHNESTLDIIKALFGEAQKAELKSVDEAADEIEAEV